MRIIKLFLISCFFTASAAASNQSPNFHNPGYQKSLEALEKTVPLTYNIHVQKQINSFLTTAGKSRFGRMLGLAEYYFPIYEKIFRDRGVPEEIKYLSVIESALNPNAVSSYGAAGLWQFLWQYGRMYGLTINDTIDERRDPALSCDAAASYLLDSYALYNDWLLAIASYNCGRNNIKWAMEKADLAGGQKDYWSLRQYLPVETQQYVPTYIATVYIMNNYRRHGIRPAAPSFNIRTETVKVKKEISLENIAKEAGINLDELLVLNAAYLNGVIYGSENKPAKLVVPLLPDYAYDTLCRTLGISNERTASIIAAAPAPIRYYISYRVQPGDTPEVIAEKFENTTAQEIIRVNNLRKDEPLTVSRLLKIPQR